MALRDYVDQYDISANLTENAFLESLKNMHKCYFSMITWNAEMVHSEADFLFVYPTCTKEIISRISEAVSDIGSSLFNWINGGYKASRIMLRAAIENFVRSVSALDDPTQLTEKNVYSLFEKADGLAVFNASKTVKDAFDQLHSDYKLLCQDTHTTTAVNMEHMTSLAGLPTFKKHKAENCRDIYVRVARNISCIFCLTFSACYHQMHHRNRENILNCLPRKMRPIVAGIS